jgi:hypothetical protein
MPLSSRTWRSPCWRPAETGGIDADAADTLAIIHDPNISAEQKLVRIERKCKRGIATDDRHRRSCQEPPVAPARARRRASRFTEDAPSFWDMTILGYWAWSAWGRTYLRLHAIRARRWRPGLRLPGGPRWAVALRGRGPVLAVSGDGGAMYGVANWPLHAAESARQVPDRRRRNPPRVDDRRIRRGLRHRAVSPRFRRAGRGARRARSADDSGVPGGGSHLGAGQRGPSVLVLRTTLRMFAPAHTSLAE